MSKTDREQIQDLMIRYGRTIDAKNLMGLRQCFTTDAIVSFGPFAADLKGGDALEAFMRHTLDRLDATHHLFMNFVVDVEADQGVFTCSVIAQHIVSGAAGGPLFTVGGDYRNDALRTTDGWKMTRMVFKPIWTDGNQTLVEHDPVTVSP